MEIAIVGGGIGGAALALALQQRGIHARVYERDAAFSSRSQGYGLTMQQAHRSLKSLGVADSVCGISSDAHFSFLPDGTLLGAFGRALYTGVAARSSLQAGAEGGVAASAAGDNGDGVDTCVSTTPVQVDEDALFFGCRGERAADAPRKPATRYNIHIPREAVRAALVNALAPGTIVWGARLESLEDSCGPAGVRLTFADGREARADVAVGADGIFSVVRRLKLLRDPAPLRYLSLMVILGRAALPHALLVDHVVQMLDGTTRVYTMPFNSSETMWQLSFPIDEAAARALHDAGPAALLARACAAVTGWHAPIPALLSATALDAVTGYPAYDRDALSPPALRGARGSRVTLLGDAAHPMSPFKGQGANQAIVDACALADELVRAAEAVAAARPLAPLPPAADCDVAHAASAPAPVSVVCATCRRAVSSKGASRFARRFLIPTSGGPSVSGEQPSGGTSGSGEQPSGGPSGSGEQPTTAAAPSPPHFTCTDCVRDRVRAHGERMKPAQPKRMRGVHVNAATAGAAAAALIATLSDGARSDAAYLAAARATDAAATLGGEDSPRDGDDIDECAAEEAEEAAAEPVAAALSRFESAMLFRAGTKALQSRAAAAYLHSPAACTPANCTRGAAARASAGMSLMGCQRKKAPIVSQNPDSGGADVSSRIVWPRPESRGHAAAAASTDDSVDAMLYSVLSQQEFEVAKKWAALLLRSKCEE